MKKAGIGLGALVLLGACFGGNDDDADKPNAGSSKSESTSESKAETIAADDAEGDSEPAEGAAEEPTLHDIWRDNYDSSQEKIRKVLSRRLPAYDQPIDSLNEALASCDEMADGRTLMKRVRKAGMRWSANPDQATVVLTVVGENVCPDVVSTHTKQVEKKRKADARAAAAARRRAAAQAKAEQERLALLQQQSQNVYYANCTAVEAAGAAPIYAGEPGYSRDLDRDGDGVACEQ